MKIWNKVKYPLLITLITAVMILLRFLMFASPTWIDSRLLFPLLFIGLLLGEFGSNVFLIALCIGAVILVPCQWEWDADREKIRRFVIRPIIAVVIMLCVSSWMVGRNRVWEKRYYEKRVNACHQQIRESVNIADEGLVHIEDFSGQK